MANIHTTTVTNFPDGMFSIAELTGKIRSPYSVHTPRSTVICLENTHNQCSGAVLPLDFMDDVSCITNEGVISTHLSLQVSRVAVSNNLQLHLDGARVFNAAVALGVPAWQVVDKCDSVSVCLSKVSACPF